MQAQSRDRALPELLSHDNLIRSLSVQRVIAFFQRFESVALPRNLNWRGVSATVAVAVSIVVIASVAHPALERVQPRLLSVLTIVELLAFGLVLSSTIAAARANDDVRRLASQSEALYAFTTSLAAASQLDQMIDAMAIHFPKTFGRPIAVMLPEGDKLAVRFCSSGLEFGETEREMMDSAFRAGRETGWSTNHLSHILCCPLITSQGIFGVLGIAASGSGFLAGNHELRLLRNFVEQAALAITRANLSEKAWHSEALKETDKLQKALLNSISHSLRTPVASVSSLLHTVLEGEHAIDFATRRQLLQTARNESLKLNQLVQNLLDMSRLEGGGLRIRTSRCDVEDVIGAALEQVDAVGARHVSIAIDPSLPWVPMDQVLIVQALVNLIDNALKYSPPGAPIEITARQSGDHIQIAVGDEGFGIAADELERVFDKFFRGSAAEAVSGTGLGLSICKGFVEAHHGHMVAVQRPQGGTEMSILLPVEGIR